MAENNDMLMSILSDLKGDIREIKENMVTYREYNHLHQEYHLTKATVDKIEKDMAASSWTHRLGEKLVFTVIGAVVATLLKLLGVF